MNQHTMNRRGVSLGSVISGATLSILCVAPMASASPIATYDFDNTFAASQAGAPSLTAVDPLGTNSFSTDTVLGTTRTVYNYTGTTTGSEQGGLTLDTTGLVANDSYTVQIVSKFIANDNAWRRIFDVDDRTSDDGLYINPSNELEAFPVTAGTDAYTNGDYHDVILSVASDNTVNGYLDGTLEFTFTNPAMNINNPDDLVTFFLDNTSGGGQGEWSAGSVALINIWDGPLSAVEVADATRDPFATGAPVPEPASMMLLGLGSVAALRRSRRRSS